MKKIGLFGYGCVGQGFSQLLAQSADIEASVERICVRNLKKERSLPDVPCSDNAEDILNDPEIDIIVELTNDTGLARRLLCHSIKHGIPFISANKKMIAEGLPLIQQNSEGQSPAIFFEGAVAGGIPVLQNVESYFKGLGIKHIRGILNGSCNFILTKMREEAKDLQTTLAEAQRLGFAESDPSLDISGLDSAYKAMILAYVAFDKIVPLESVALRGIDELTKAELDSLSHADKKVKLIAHISRENGEVMAWVQPEVIDCHDALYAINGESNAVEIDTIFSGKHLLTGKGAGSLPTGAAVLNDLRQSLKSRENIRENVVSFC